jgi:hypothetical protein
VKDAIGVGLDPATAQRDYGHLMVADERVSKARAAVLPNARMLVAASAIYDSWCQSTQSSDGKVKTQACVTRYFDQQNGSDWYLADKHQASGQSTDTSFFPKRLKHIHEFLSWSANNQTVQWNPGSTQSITNNQCVTLGVGITSQRTNVGYNLSATICPDNFGPQVLDTGTTNTKFGTQWNGNEQGTHWEAVESVDLVHSPSNASSSATLTVSQTWCC